MSSIIAHLRTRLLVCEYFRLKYPPSGAEHMQIFEKQHKESGNIIFTAYFPGVEVYGPFFRAV